MKDDEAPEEPTEYEAMKMMKHGVEKKKKSHGSMQDDLMVRVYKRVQEQMAVGKSKDGETAGSTSG